MKKARWVLLTTALMAGFYGLWAFTGRALPKAPVATAVAAFKAVGIPTGRGNLVGIQPWMEPTDYATQERFQQKMDGYFKLAQRQGWLVPEKTIVILPEYVGTWLVAAGEKAAVYAAPTVQDALTTMVASNLPSFLRHYIAAPASTADPVKHAVFAMKGQEMGKAYQKTFAYLARSYRVTIVAGSVLLPAPTVEKGQLRTGSGPLYNVSAVFRPDGTLEPQLVRKVYPITDELPFVCPSNPAEVPVYQTPIGKLGVLVCADSWNSPVYQTLKQKGAALIAVPSYSAGENVWQTVWKGYSGTATPADARADVGRLTEGQAWLAHAMGGRAKREAGIRKGINVFLRGKLWDLGSDGTTVILNDSTSITTRVDGAALTCLWL